MGRRGKLALFLVCLAAIQALVGLRAMEQSANLFVPATENVDDQEVLIGDEDVNELTSRSVSGAELEGGEEEREDNDGLPSILSYNTLFHSLSRNEQFLGQRKGLPRTSTRPYNLIEGDEDEKFFVYTPSGGFNNQLASFIAGMCLARLSGRTLIAPMAGKHSNYFDGYMRLTLDDLLPMDQLLDFEHLEKVPGIRLVPMNVTLDEFHRVYLKEAPIGKTTNGIQMEHIKTSMTKLTPSTQGYFQRLLKNSKERVVVFYGRFYSYKWRPLELYQQIQYSSYLRALSRVIVKGAFGDEAFNSFHLRLGDYEAMALKKNSDARSFVKHSKKHGFEKDKPVYLATDGKVFAENGTSFEPYYRPLSYFEKLVTYRKLQSIPAADEALQDFVARLPVNVVNDMFGLVEQLICAQADNFVGTAFSTFSKTIRRMRRFLSKTFPEAPTERLQWTVMVNWGGVVEDAINHASSWTSSLTEKAHDESPA